MLEKHEPRSQTCKQQEYTQKTRVLTYQVCLNAHHTLADFDESYLHAFKELKRKLQHCHGSSPINCRGPPHTSRQDPSGRLKIKHV